MTVSGVMPRSLAIFLLHPGPINSRRSRSRALDDLANTAERARRGARLVAVAAAHGQTVGVGEGPLGKTGAFRIPLKAHQQSADRRALIQNGLTDVGGAAAFRALRNAFEASAARSSSSRALCDVARLPVREVVLANHYLTDLTLGLGEVVFDYLKDA